MSAPKVEWVAGTATQLGYYDLEARVEADYQVSVVVGEPWVFVARDDGEHYGAVMVGAIDLDSAGYPLVAASAMGIAPARGGLVDAHEAAINGLRALEERLATEPIPFAPVPVVK